MLNQKRFLRGLKLAAVVAAALSMVLALIKIRWTGGAAGWPALRPGQPAGFRGQCRRPRFLRERPDQPVAQAITTLEKQARWLQTYNRYSFTVEGHADERGTREYNIALGARRAQAVRSFLASRGIDPGRMRTISYGKERPVAVCNDISCWSQNRRAVTVLNASS